MLPCSSDSQAYSLRGCLPELCVEPPAAESAEYLVTVQSLARPSFRATASCRQGGQAAVLPCRADGLPYELRGCGLTGST